MSLNKEQGYAENRFLCLFSRKKGRARSRVTRNTKRPERDAGTDEKRNDNMSNHVNHNSTDIKRRRRTTGVFGDSNDDDDDDDDEYRYFPGFGWCNVTDIDYEDEVFYDYTEEEEEEERQERELEEQRQRELNEQRRREKEQQQRELDKKFPNGHREPDEQRLREYWNEVEKLMNHARAIQQQQEMERGILRDLSEVARERKRKNEMVEWQKQKVDKGDK
jgi:hypothetical protein